MAVLLLLDKDNNATRIGGSENRLELSESEIEEILFNNPDAIGSRFMFIGKQVNTDSKKRIDLLAVDDEARLVILELKKGISPRDVVAQVLDYASWLEKQSERRIEEIAADHFTKHHSPYSSLIEGFQKSFGRPPSRRVGDEIAVVLIAQEFSQEVLDATDYLNDKGIPISCVEFEAFSSSDGGKYFYLHDVVGEWTDTGEVDRVATVYGTKADDREIMLNLCAELEARFGEWASNLDCERLHEFKLYQARDGDWTASYVDWNCNGVEFCLEAYICRDEGKDSFGIQIFARKNSSELDRAFRDNFVLEFLESNGFMDESRKMKPAYYRELGADPGYEHLRNLCIREIDVAKPMIERILSQIGSGTY